MARLNTVTLIGRVEADPKIIVNNEDDPDSPDGRDYLQGALVLNVLRRSSAGEDWMLQGHARWDVIRVFSRHPSMIRQMEKTISHGDVVLIKGTLVTQDVARKFVCPSCGHVQYKDFSVTVYVDPVLIVKLRSVADKEQVYAECDADIHAQERNRLQNHPDVKPISQDNLDMMITQEYKDRMEQDKNAAYDYIKDKIELSNMVDIVGTVCKEPDPYYCDPETGFLTYSFTIATDRLRYILEDDPDKKVDYPVVKCFGENCELYDYALHVGSEVLIDGALQSRKVEQNIPCEKCGEIIPKIIRVIEIIPYHVEFLKNCNSPKELLEEDNTNVEAVE